MNLIFIELFLDWENFIVSNRPVNRKKQTKETLRATIRREINITKLDTQKNDPLCDQFSHFENVIKQEVKPKVSLEDGIINVSILEKIMSALK